MKLADEYARLAEDALESGDGVKAHVYSNLSLAAVQREAVAGQRQAVKVMTDFALANTTSPELPAAPPVDQHLTEGRPTSE